METQAYLHPRRRFFYEYMHLFSDQSEDDCELMRTNMHDGQNSF